ncbi:hypothetical protein BJV82DRAFT_609766 [Fennellomyces sp. T-0311]|nr:hypothetical protein BJV82DRAFT_609766 [Fennellomyces sp. T-0311]
MSLDSAIDYLRSKTDVAITLSAPSKAIDEWLQTSSENNNCFIRNAAPHERQLYAINENDAVPGRRHNIGRKSIGPGGQPRDIERLLSAATNLNKICNVPDIQEIIERFRQEQDTHQTDLDYLNATYSENKIEIERLTKAVKTQSIQPDGMDIDSISDNESSHEARNELRLDNEVKRLESRVVQKKSELIQSQEMLQHQEQAAETVEAQQSTTDETAPMRKSLSPPPPPTITDPNGSFSNLQISLQEIFGGAPASYTDRLGAVRRELLRTVLSDQDTNEKKVMAKVVQLLEAEENHRMLLEHLKQSVSEFATSINLKDSEGSQAIYKLNAYKLVIIDRSQADSFVQLA